MIPLIQNQQINQENKIEKELHVKDLNLHKKSNYQVEK